MTAAFAVGGLEQGLLYGIMVVGVFISYRILTIPDLTVDGSFTLGGAVVAAGLVAGLPPWAAMALAWAAGFAAGAVSGVLHARFGMAPLLAGILTMTGLYSVNLRIMGRANVPLLMVETAVSRARERFAAPADLPGGIGTLVLGSCFALAVVLAVAWFLSTETGLALRALGDNEQMAKAAAVDTGSLKILGLGLSNAIVALSGSLVAQYQGFSDVGMGLGTIVAGLASVIIGEAAVRRGGVMRGLVACVAGSAAYRFAVALVLRAGLAPSDLKLFTALLVGLAMIVPQNMASARKLAALARR